METVNSPAELKKYKLALGRWESEGGAPAPNLPHEAARNRDDRRAFVVRQPQTQSSTSGSG